MAWHRRKKAISKLIGSYEDNYTNLKSYYHQIKTMNLMNFTKLEVDEENYFLKIFVTYNTSLHCLQYCELVISLNDTHLKRKYCGIFFIATIIDIEE